MSYGSTAYESYVRIHLESGEPQKPSWHALPHIRRLAWEAAAQAVAMAILPPSLNPEFYEDSESDEEDEIQTGIEDTQSVPTLEKS